jgi:signal recognition particle GTPase
LFSSFSFNSSVKACPSKERTKERKKESKQERKKESNKERKKETKKQRKKKERKKEERKSESNIQKKQETIFILPNLFSIDQLRFSMIFSTLHLYSSSSVTHRHRLLLVSNNKSYIRQREKRVLLVRKNCWTLEEVMMKMKKKMI